MRVSLTICLKLVILTSSRCIVWLFGTILSKLPDQELFDDDISNNSSVNKSESTNHMSIDNEKENEKDDDEVMDKVDENKNDDNNPHKDDNDKEKDKNDEKGKDESPSLSEGSSYADDNEVTTMPRPPALRDSADEDLIERARKHKDIPEHLKTPSPTRRTSKRLKTQTHILTPEQREEQKLKSSNLKNTGATDPLKSNNE